MEAVGKLTGGVAHDFNNVLQILRGNLELVTSRYSREEWLMSRLVSALDAVDRGAKLASQLLAFGRRQASRAVSVNLASMTRGMDDLLRRALGETVLVETIVSGGLWNAMVDLPQLENVVLNLAINARDAMPISCFPASSPGCSRLPRSRSAHACTASTQRRRSVPSVMGSGRKKQTRPLVPNRGT